MPWTADVACFCPTGICVPWCQVPWFPACSLPLLPLPEPRTYTSSCLRSLQLHKCTRWQSRSPQLMPHCHEGTQNSAELLAVHVHTAELRPITNLHFQHDKTSDSSLCSQAGPLCHECTHSWLQLAACSGLTTTSICNRPLLHYTGTCSW